MKQFLFPLFLAFRLIGSEPESVTEQEKPATVKVLLARGLEGALIEVKGPHKIYNPHNQRLLKTHLLGKRYYMHGSDKGLKWGKSFHNVHQISIVPSSAHATILVGGTEYRGCLNAYVFDNRIALVNEVSVEDFLKSTLTAEVERSVPKEVLDAMAILARTNAYFTAMHKGREFWHVKASDIDYYGHGMTLLNTAVDSSVDGTRHLILTYNERPFPTTWTENSAGQTASYNSIFRSALPSPKGVAAPLAERDRKEAHWCFTLSREEMAQIIGVQNFSEIDLFVDQDSLKVYGLRAKDDKSHKDIDFISLQKALGESRLLSNDFTVKQKEGHILFEGYGEGYGVGLCLYSARAMVQRGEMAPKILKAFFPACSLTRVRSYEEFFKNPVAASE